MTKSTTCNGVEQALACHQTLTPMQSEHMKTCPECTTHREAYAQLDELITSGLSVNPPGDFADRVMSVIETEAHPPLVERLLASLPLRLCLISGATILFVVHIFRFILTAFFVTMAAT